MMRIAFLFIHCFALSCNPAQHAEIPSSPPALMHLAILAVDVDSTLAFYKNAFGFTRTYESSEIIDTQTGEAFFQGRGVFLDLGGQTFLEIFPGGDSGQSASTGPFLHFALNVADVDQSYERALAAGGRKYGFTSPPAWDGSPTSIKFNGEPPMEARVAFVEGLNGEVIELYHSVIPFARSDLRTGRY